VLDLSLIPPPGDTDVIDEEIANDDDTPMSHPISTCELSSLINGLDSWKIDQVPWLTRREFLSDNDDAGTVCVS